MSVCAKLKGKERQEGTKEGKERFRETNPEAEREVGYWSLGRVNEEESQAD